MTVTATRAKKNGQSESWGEFFRVQVQERFTYLLEIPYMIQGDPHIVLRTQEEPAEDRPTWLAEGVRGKKRGRKKSVRGLGMIIWYASDGKNYLNQQIQWYVIVEKEIRGSIGQQLSKYALSQSPWPILSRKWRCLNQSGSSNFEACSNGLKIQRYELQHEICRTKSAWPFDQWCQKKFGAPRSDLELVWRRKNHFISLLQLFVQVQPKKIYVIGFKCISIEFEKSQSAAFSAWYFP